MLKRWWIAPGQASGAVEGRSPVTCEPHLMTTPPMGIFVFPLPGGLYLKVQPAGGKHKGKWYMKINGIQDRNPQAYPESLEENDLRNSALKLAARSGGVVTLDMIMDQMMTLRKRIMVPGEVTEAMRPPEPNEPVPRAFRAHPLWFDPKRLLK